MGLLATLVMSLTVSACGGSDEAPPAVVTPAAIVRGANIPDAVLTSLPIENIGGADRRYPFLAVDFDLATFGFVQEEFTIEGKANVYDTPGPSGGTGENTAATPTANVVTPDVPYKTRMVVIRPTDPTKFNGTVLVEWQNVTNGYDIPVHWVQQKEMILRKGYAWVGVSVQSAGITTASGLKAWSPARYGTLDITNGGKVTGDLLGYDIFSQAAKAARSPKNMGGLVAKRLIAIGASQSAGRLGIYLNSVHALTDVFDGALMAIGGGRMRTDLKIPIIKVLTQTEVTNSNPSQLAALQPDTDKFHTWMIAGAAHSDSYGITARAQMVNRDLGLSIGDNCTLPSRSRVPTRYVYNSAIDKLERYIDAGTPLLTVTALQGLTAGSPPTIAVDARGISVGGGVRLGEVVAPIAVDTGANGGGNNCQLNGSHQPFDKATLDTLYPTHDSYVSKYTAAYTAAVAAGHILQEDADEAIENARNSIIGYGLNCGLLCADVSQFTKQPSIGTLRAHIAAYRIPDQAAMLENLDDAAFWIATGYLNADPASARPSFRLAFELLAKYSAQLDAQAVKKTLSTSTVNYLKAQATTLMTELNKL